MLPSYIKIKRNFKKIHYLSNLLFRIYQFQDQSSLYYHPLSRMLISSNCARCRPVCVSSFHGELHVLEKRRVAIAVTAREYVDPLVRALHTVLAPSRGCVVVRQGKRDTHSLYRSYIQSVPGNRREIVDGAASHCADAWGGGWRGVGVARPHVHEAWRGARSSKQVVCVESRGESRAPRTSNSDNRVYLFDETRPFRRASRRVASSSSSLLLSSLSSSSSSLCKKISYHGERNDRG